MSYATNSSKRKYKGAFVSGTAKTRSIFRTVFSGFFYTSLILLMFIGILWFCRQMNNTAKFSIDQVEFTTSPLHISTSTLQKISLPFTKKNFFTVDLFELKKRIIRIPWVHEVTILRVWPNGLSVRVKEQHAVARLSQTRLLNKALEIFSVPASTVPSCLPEFICPAGQLKVMWQNYEAIEAILKPLALHVVHFELSERQSWRLKLNNGLKLILGQMDGLDHLRRFVGVYNQIITPQNMDTIDYIDLRYPHGMAVSSQIKSGRGT